MSSKINLLYLHLAHFAYLNYQSSDFQNTWSYACKSKRYKFKKSQTAKLDDHSNNKKYNKLSITSFVNKIQCCEFYEI